MDEIVVQDDNQLDNDITINELKTTYRNFKVNIALMLTFSSYSLVSGSIAIMKSDKELLVTSALAFAGFIINRVEYGKNVARLDHMCNNICSEDSKQLTKKER